MGQNPEFWIRVLQLSGFGFGRVPSTFKKSVRVRFEIRKRRVPVLHPRNWKDVDYGLIVIVSTS